MSNISGTAGDDTYVGNVGTADTADISSSLSESTFTWDGTNWVVNSPAGVDTLVSIEAAQFADGLVGVAGGAGETRVNSTTANDQFQPAITGLADGGYVVTWTSYGQDGAEYGVYAQRYDSSGAASGGEMLVNSTTASHQYQPATAALADGGYVVTWMSYYQDGSGWGIYAQRYDDTGATVGGETQINTTTGNDQHQPAITGLADGGYVVTWSSYQGSGYGIFAQRYDSSGAAVGGETQINTIASYQEQPAITALSDGGYVVTWMSYAWDANGWEVSAQRFDSTGAAVGGETKVNSTVASDQYYPAITALTDGGYVVTWMSHSQDGGGWGIFAQQYDAAGAAVGSETQVNSTTASDQYQATITGLADGGYVVTWMSAGQDGNGWGIYAQRYDATGTAVGGETRINSTTSGDQYEAGITALADGGYVVTWVASWQDGSGGGIYAQRFNADGSPDMPTLTGDDNGNRLVASGGTSLHLLGAGGDDLLASGSGNDWLDGGAGDDTLDGGTGADNLAGGAGNDVYIVDAASDLVVEAAAGGIDTVVSSVSYALSEDLENLTLSGTSALDATGNASDNVLAGNAANNRLDGGAGSDTAVIESSMAGSSIGFDGREWVVTSTQGTDTLLDIESLQFADGSVTLSAVTPGETRVNTTTSQSQQDPAVTALADGGYVVTWMSYSQDGSGWNIHAQRYDGSGAPAGSETQINSMASSDQHQPAITGLADGGYVVTWMSYQGSGYGIYAQRYDSTGTALGSETQINSDTGNYKEQPAITALADGGFVVTWMSHAQDGSGWGVYAQQYDSSGTPVGGETQVNSTTINQQQQPATTALADGGYVVTWMSYGQDGSDWGIYAQRYDNAGAAVGGETQISNAANDQQHPAITALSDGGYLVTWMSNYQDGSDWGVYAQRFDSTGAAVGGETQINSTAASYQYLPAVTALADGGYVVTWMSYWQDGSGWGIYAQRYDNAGAAVGGETRINSTTANDQNQPTITGLADGGYVVTWMSLEQDGSGWGIYTQRFTGPDKVLGLTGDDAANTLNVTGAWNYEIDGAGGDDMLRSGSGADRLDGSDGNDTLQGGAGVDTLVGGAGNDLFLVGRDADAVVEGVDGGTDLGISTATSYTLADGVENLLLRAPAVNGTGNEQANMITGNAAANMLDGAGGNDTLRGDAGDDTLIGGTGDDLFFVDSGADVVTELEGGGTDRVISTAASYTLGAGVDHLSLGAGALEGIGNDLANRVTGNAEANSLLGSAGNDTLQGSAGADSLAGGDGSDILIAGSGVDVLTGGADADIFRVSGVRHSGVGSGTRDVILDFVQGSDRIDLSGIDANRKVTGDQAFTLIQGDAFSRTAGELRYVQDGGSLVLEGDVNGDAVADFQIEIVGAPALATGDLLL